VRGLNAEPLTRISPESGITTSLNALTRVDLPAPDLSRLKGERHVLESDGGPVTFADAANVQKSSHNPTSFSGRDGVAVPPLARRPDQIITSPPFGLSDAPV
jgi:hypothetical protein